MSYKLHGDSRGLRGFFRLAAPPSAAFNHSASWQSPHHLTKLSAHTLLFLSNVVFWQYANYNFVFRPMMQMESYIINHFPNAPTFYVLMGKICFSVTPRTCDEVIDRRKRICKRCNKVYSTYFNLRRHARRRLLETS